MEGSWVNQEQLHTFHSIDREVFSRMVINLMRDPAECLIVVAAWLWLEQMGYPNIIVLMTSLPDAVIDLLSDEMALALASLQSSAATGGRGGFMPGTSAIMSGPISVDLFHQNRFTAITGIKSILTTICARIFTDILTTICPLSSSSSSNNNNGAIGALPPRPHLLIPGFPHPLFGNLTISPPMGPNGLLLDHFAPAGGLWGWNPNNNATEDDRTLFLTFSRGFPVTKEEVTELFTSKYGEGSVVSVLMQENVTASDQQPLFARMLLRSVMIVDEVLNGDRIAKFRINGKHIWARKYERRDQTTAPPTPPRV